MFSIPLLVIMLQQCQRAFPSLVRDSPIFNHSNPCMFHPETAVPPQIYIAAMYRVRGHCAVPPQLETSYILLRK